MMHEVLRTPFECHNLHSFELFSILSHLSKIVSSITTQTVAHTSSLEPSDIRNEFSELLLIFLINTFGSA